MHYGESSLRYPKTYNGVIYPFNVKMKNHNLNTFAIFMCYVLISLLRGNVSCSVIVQVLCSYSTLPLYTIVTQVIE